MLKPALQSFASVPSTVIALADRPSCPDHEPQDDQLCSTRSEMVTQKAGGSTTEPASPLGAEYGPLDQTVCDGGEAAVMVTFCPILQWLPPPIAHAK